MQIAKKTIASIVISCIAALGDLSFSQSSQNDRYSHLFKTDHAIKIEVKLDPFDRPLEIYSYYLADNQKIIMHGQRIRWDYKNAMLITEDFMHGQRVHLKSTQMPGWNPEKYKESK